MRSRSDEEGGKEEREKRLDREVRMEEEERDQVRRREVRKEEGGERRRERRRRAHGRRPEYCEFRFEDLSPRGRERAFDAVTRKKDRERRGG